MPITLKLQTLRKGTPYASYRITLPKNVIELKGWQKTNFELELKEDRLILKPVKNRPLQQSAAARKKKNL